MNLNKKIKKFTADGIPEYNAKINELIDGVNWLAGMRVINGKPISESDQGPIFDLSQANNTQQPGSSWALDPDGKPAGWLKAIVFDPALQKAWTQWIWAGPALTQENIPWINDPSGNPATWIVCAGPTFWGTGTCPVAAGNYVHVGSGNSNPPSANPSWWTFTAVQTVTPPNSPPSFYWVSDNTNNAPTLFMSGGPSDPSLTEDVSFTFEILLGSSLIYSAEGSAVVGRNINTYWPIPIPSGQDWRVLFDPGGLPGYQHGSGLWVWQYLGSVPTSGTPTIKEQLTWSSPSGQPVTFIPTNFNTGYAVIFFTQ